MEHDGYVEIMVQDLLDLLEAHVEYFDADLLVPTSIPESKDMYDGDVVIAKIAPNLIKFIGDNGVCLTIAVWRMPNESPRE